MSNELQHIIDSKRELLRRETVLRSPMNYSAAMPSDQKDRYIRYLIESSGGEGFGVTCHADGGGGIPVHP